MQDYFDHEMGSASDYFTFALINPNLLEPDRYLASNLAVITRNDAAIFKLVAVHALVGTIYETRPVSCEEEKNYAESSADDADEILSNWSDESLFTADTVSFELEKDQLLPEAVESKYCRFLFNVVLNIIYGLFKLFKFVLNHLEHFLVWTVIVLIILGCHMIVTTVSDRINLILKTVFFFL